jgi:16S rRNA (guanine527-N7)-methyltransferase
VRREHTIAVRLDRGIMTDAELSAVLGAARDRGLLGASVPIDEQIAHARAFAAPVEHEPTLAVDLGSGGGLPGLVLAAHWPGSHWVLVDAQQKRTDFLSWAVTQLGWAERVVVRHGRAEDLAREPELRGRCDLVVARSFGAPAVVAECATGFLRIGGRLVVSEPPVLDAARWDTESAEAGLGALGLRAAPFAPPTDVAAPHLRAFVQAVSTPERYPRRAGIPAKRPLF